MLPYSRDALLFLLEDYNLAVWPAQAIAVALALLVLALVLRPSAGSAHPLAAVLALAWLWTGLVFHALYFAAINFWAYGFAALFVAQGLLFAASALRGRPSFAFRRDASGWAGLALAVVALAGYPLAAWLAGHAWPRLPVLGLAPGPTAVFTLGLLLMAQPRAPIHLLVVPMIWAAIGGAAALVLGLPEDILLLAAAAIALVVMVLRRFR